MNVVEKLIIKHLMNIKWKSSDGLRVIGKMEADHMENVILYLANKLEKADKIGLTLSPYEGHSTEQWLALFLYVHRLKMTGNIDRKTQTSLVNEFLDWGDSQVNFKFNLGVSEYVSKEGDTPGYNDEDEEVTDPIYNQHESMSYWA
jgi:hypothetical protein